MRDGLFVNACLLLVHENENIKRHGRKHDLKTWEEMPAWYAQVKTWKVQQKWITEAWFETIMTALRGSMSTCILSSCLSCMWMILHVYVSMSFSACGLFPHSLGRPVSKRCSSLSTCVLGKLSQELHKLQTYPRTNVGSGTPGKKRSLEESDVLAGYGEALNRV